MRKIFNSITAVALLWILTTSNLFAAGDSAEESLYTAAKYMLIITVAIIALILWLVVNYSEKNDSSGRVFLEPLIKFKNFVMRSTPVEEEDQIIFDHDYDGIKELDNKIPPWFSFMFYGTILFAIIYMVQYHVIGSGNVQAEEYQAEMKQAKLERQLLIRSGAFINEESVTKLTDASAIQSGKEIFQKECSACHAKDGGGLVGPNLTDDYWIHGATIKDVFKTIKYGVPQKGMVSWESILTPKQMQETASYVLLLQGTNPDNPKPPEGEKIIPSNEEEENI